VEALKELQENTAKQVEDLNEETQKFLKELQENTTKQAMELNRAIQDLKMEIETINKTQRETTLEIEILGKKSGTIDASISNRIQEMEEENLRCRRCQRKHGHNNQRKCKIQKDPNSKHPGNSGHNE
jgi:prefoldin subunit 5